VIASDTSAAGVAVMCTAQSAGGPTSYTVTILKDSTAPHSGPQYSNAIDVSP